MAAKEPDVTGFGKGRLLHLPVHIEVILFHFFVVDFGKELFHFRCLKACQVYIEIDALQIHDEVSQELFVPGPCDFVERDVKGLDLVFIFNMDNDTLDFFIPQVFQHIEPLVASDDCHVVVHDDGFHITELFNGVLDFSVFLVTWLQLLPGIIRRRFELADRQDFPFHIR